MEKFLTVAKIVKPQGIRGEVKALALTDSAEQLAAFGRVYIGGEPYKVLKLSPRPDGSAYIALSGIADRNAAELLRGKEICVLREDAPELPEGRYYIADLLGCAVVGEKGEAIGRVTEITPAHTDVYELEKEGGGKLVFPAADGVITDVNIEQGVITVNKKRLAEVGLEVK